jgi:RNA polymerase sigma-70 factor, ECF subfamily
VVEDVMNSAGRQEEVTALVNAHYAMLYRYAYRLSGSAADAEDLTQLAFLTAQEKLDQLRAAQNAKAWLYAIVRNAYLKTRRGTAASGSVSLECTGEPAQMPDEPPELTGEELTELLDELPDDFRVPLVLFYFEEMSYRDIAATLGVPIGTVMSRLSRGKAHLRQQLAARHVVPSE